MKTIDIITALRLYAKTDDKAILSSMLDTLEQEYRREEVKKAGGNQAVKRLKLAEKILKQNQKDSLREVLNKCITFEIDGEKFQAFGTAYYQIALKEAYKTPLDAWGDNEYASWRNTVASCFTDEHRNYTSVEFDLTEIKTEFAQWKAEQKRKPPKMRDEFCVVRLGNTGYNAEYFINCVEALGGDVTFLQNGNRTGMSFFESEIGKSLIMPIRLTN